MTGMISTKIQKAAVNHFYQKFGRGVFGTSELPHFYCDMFYFYYFYLRSFFAIEDFGERSLGKDVKSWLNKEKKRENFKSYGSNNNEIGINTTVNPERTIQSIKKTRA